MHGRIDKADIKRQVTVHGKPALEYDGLRPAELAWILGRRFKVMKDSDGDVNDDGRAGGAGNSLQELRDHQMYGHQAYAGVGFGVDRMQRLASTAWVEALFEQKLVANNINLHDIYLDSGYNTAMDSQANIFKDVLAGSSAINCIDVTYALAVIAFRKSPNPAAAATAAVGDRRLQGIFCRETGPFLRGLQVKPDIVSIPSVKNVNNPLLGEELSRQLGSEMCFSALEIEMRRRNLMDWTPDGVVLSKLEDGDPTTTAQIDARMAQLFNIAISGPAISTTWTSDLRDSKMECQPMDKVFIVIVADLACTYGAEDDGFGDAQDDRGSAAYDQLVILRRKGAVHTALLAQRQNLLDNKSSTATIDAAIVTVKGEIEAAKAALKTAQDDIYANDDAKYISKDALYKQTKRYYDDIMENVASTTDDKNDAADRLRIAKEGIDDEMFFEWDDDELEEFARFQARLRSGQQIVTTAKLMNFRLVRMTSSYMNNYSKWTPNNPKSRLGLPMGGNSQSDGMASYIIGGWCIGTVLDSAASRSTVGQMVRTAPCSMALNINVNVEWWSADRLFQSYMDRDGLVTSRGQLPPGVAGVPYKTTNLYKDAAFKPSYSGNVDEAGAAVNTDDSEYEGVEIEAPAFGANIRAAKVAGQKSKRQRRSSTGGGLEATLAEDETKKKKKNRTRKSKVTSYEFGVDASAWSSTSRPVAAEAQSAASATSCSASSGASAPPAPRSRAAAPVGAPAAKPVQGSAAATQSPVSAIRESVSVRRSSAKK